ncbi:TAF6-like RNA polymerase II p300/CBP-associated factor-associated factor 65 kDa subunit 6L [Anneissia japonica]|uniref:TAF6-like RNA polymerase II p300/CBP-associated factor-associated factor 65 kDa subunit 6L n=1 Tax=Anneissia japonica TaxID=1529436 RepID=UPI0014257BC9|nr:TAF6-like RNA polymerase II p300/CBP-associated factor-associated factor 65 kDa subunit 6L [Anneissia japonica]
MSDERKYAVLSKESIKLIAGTVGFDSLPDDIATALAEDVTYRLREAAQSSVQFMKHARRRKLTSEDFNRALRWSDLEPICGSNLKDFRSFRHSKEAEVFFIEDKEISLADVSLDITQHQNNGKNSIQAQWLAIEGVNQGSNPSKTSSVTLGPSLSDEHSEYYEQVTSACLGKDEAAIKAALADLRSNSKIGALLPFLLNFVTSNINKVTHNLKQLNKLLHMAQSLINNSNLFLGPYLKNLVSSLVHCILEPLSASVNPVHDHWLLREYAVLLLGQTLRSLKSHSETIHQQLVETFEQVLTDPHRPLCCHYGALMGLVVLGPQAIESILLHNISSLFMIIEEASTSNYQSQLDARKVLGALQMAAEVLLHSKLQSQDNDDDSPCRLPSGGSSSGPEVFVKNEVSDHLTPMDYKDFSVSTCVNDLYKTLSDYFGESLSTRINASTALPLLFTQELRPLVSMEKYRLDLASKMLNQDITKHKETKQSSSRIRSSTTHRGRSVHDVFNYAQNVKVENMNIDCTIAFNVDGFKQRPPRLLKRRNVSKSLEILSSESSKFAILNKHMKVSGKRRSWSWCNSRPKISAMWFCDIW